MSDDFLKAISLPSWITISIVPDGTVRFTTALKSGAEFFVKFRLTASSTYKNTWEVAIKTIANKIFDDEYPDEYIPLMTRAWNADRVGEELSETDKAMMTRRKELGLAYIGIQD